LLAPFGIEKSIMSQSGNLFWKKWKENLFTI